MYGKSLVKIFGNKSINNERKKDCIWKRASGWRYIWEFIGRKGGKEMKWGNDIIIF